MPFKTPACLLVMLTIAICAQPADTVQGIRIASRIPCDGSTNFREELNVQPTFSPGAWERSFRLDEFEAQYCKHGDLYFVCLKRGHDGWKLAWSADSLQPASSNRVWLNSCSSWGSAQASEYQLSGWYKEAGADRKTPWQQAAIKQLSAAPEIYEFTDPAGGTARLEIRRR